MINSESEEDAYATGQIVTDDGWSGEYYSEYGQQPKLAKVFMLNTFTKRNIGLSLMFYYKYILANSNQGTEMIVGAQDGVYSGLSGTNLGDLSGQSQQYYLPRITGSGGSIQATGWAYNRNPDDVVFSGWKNKICCCCRRRRIKSWS